MKSLKRFKVFNRVTKQQFNSYRYEAAAIDMALTLNSLDDTYKSTGIVNPWDIERV